MKGIRIIRRSTPEHWRAEDCARIVKCFNDRKLQLYPSEAFELWTMFSRTMGEDWCNLRCITDEQIMFSLLQHFEVIGEITGEIEHWISHP